MLVGGPERVCWTGVEEDMFERFLVGIVGLRGGKWMED